MKCNTPWTQRAPPCAHLWMKGYNMTRTWFVLLPFKVLRYCPTIRCLVLRPVMDTFDGHAPYTIRVGGGGQPTCHLPEVANNTRHALHLATMPAFKQLGINNSSFFSPPSGNRHVGLPHPVSLIDIWEYIYIYTHFTYIYIYIIYIYIYIYIYMYVYIYIYIFIYIYIYIYISLSLYIYIYIYIYT